MLITNSFSLSYGLFFILFFLVELNKGFLFIDIVKLPSKSSYGKYKKKKKFLNFTIDRQFLSVKNL